MDNAVKVLRGAAFHASALELLQRAAIAGALHRAKSLLRLISTDTSGGCM
jgi:hypothetical protein